jgi:hypothetical protein
MVVLTPVPVIVVPPGVLVNVQIPVAGKPFKIALPVATVHVGCVIIPTVGAVGVVGCVLIITFPDAAEIHPDALVTVYENTPAVSPDMVLLDPVPVMPPGFIVHMPDAGRPFNTTLPVATVHVGCTVDPTVGVVGDGDWVLITTFDDATEVHPDSLVTL